MAKKFEGVLLCSDIDGTMYHKGFIPSNLEALHYFMSEGGLFTFCTGRRAINAPTEIDPNVPIVGMCGSEIYDRATDTMVAQWAFGEEWRQITRDLQGRDDVREVLFESDIAYRYPSNTPELMEYIDTFTGPIYKIIFFYKEPHREPELIPNDVRAYCEGKSSVMSNGDSSFEMTALGHDKAGGVLFLKERTGARLLVCAGDWDGDISMIKAADIGYAVGSATASVIAAADRVTVGVKDGAIAQIIRDLEEELCK